MNKKLIELSKKESNRALCAKNIIINYIKNKLIKDTDLYSLARVGRNDLCICGSGKKFKHCHGKI